MPEKLISSKELFKGRAVRLSRVKVRKSSGVMAEREIVDHNDCVAIIPFDQDNNVILVKQFRTPIGKELLEIPAGSIESGEDPEDCVRRELQEETGYLPEIIIPIGGIYAAPGYCTEFLHLYLARNLKESRLIAEDTDEIEIVRVPIAEIPGLIKTGQICDGKSVSGLLRVITEQPG